MNLSKQMEKALTEQRNEFMKLLTEQRDTIVKLQDELDKERQERRQRRANAIKHLKSE